MLDREDSSENVTTAESPPAGLLTAADLRARARAANTPIYWVGPRARHWYQLTRGSDRAAFVRYVPFGKTSADPRTTLTVATYPSSQAFADVRAASRRQSSATLAVPFGGLGTYDRNRPTNVFVAFPGVGAQVEVFDPQASRAQRAVRRGLVMPVTRESAAAAQPFVATSAELRALASRLRHPVYWVGPRAGARYEVTRTGDGTVYVRYLPSGVAAGDPRRGLLTVATYPRTDALGDVRAAAERPGAQSFDLPAGGLAVYDDASPENVHLAFPGVDRQVEVYSTELDVGALVRAGEVVPVR